MFKIGVKKVQVHNKRGGLESLEKTWSSLFTDPGSSDADLMKVNDKGEPDPQYNFHSSLMMR